jgi:hypothetical protein
MRNLVTSGVVLQFLLIDPVKQFQKLYEGFGTQRFRRNGFRKKAQRGIEKSSVNLCVSSV